MFFFREDNTIHSHPQNHHCCCSSSHSSFQIFSSGPSITAGWDNRTDTVIMALIVRCVRGYMCHATIDRNVKHVVLPAHTNRLRETNAIVIFLQILIVSFQLCLLHFRTLREHISPRTHHIYCWIFKSDLCIFVGFDSTLGKFNVRMTCISANDQFLLENTFEWVSE